MLRIIEPKNKIPRKVIMDKNPNNMFYPGFIAMHKFCCGISKYRISDGSSCTGIIDDIRNDIANTTSNHKMHIWDVKGLVAETDAINLNSKQLIEKSNNGYKNFELFCDGNGLFSLIRHFSLGKIAYLLEYKEKSKTIIFEWL